MFSRVWSHDVSFVSRTREVLFGRPSDGTVRSDDFGAFLGATIAKGGPNALHALALRDYVGKQANDAPLFGSLLNLSSGMTNTGGLVGINDYGVKGRRQYAAERRRLLDLYTIVMNNGDIRTAVTHLRNEIFRRGLEWEPSFEFKCDACGDTYTEKEAKKMKYRCDCTEYDEALDNLGIEEDEDHEPGYPLRRPDKAEIKKFDEFLDRVNYFGQSFETILRICEDDLNIVDDAFIYFRKRYSIGDGDLQRAKKEPFNPKYRPSEEVIQIFRLDPTLMEFDMDARGLPGQAHHVCVIHRDILLDVPYGEGWDIRWGGVCPECGLMTYPVYYKYSEQQSGTMGASRPIVLYLVRDEVIHWSRYSPSETYGFSPVLSIYEKALTLIGMDRYLYDYFYERKIPQGVIAVTTDDVTSFNASKADVEAKMQQDPHYIPWVAIASKTGQGRMEFVRFAYSLDELDYLPVRDEIRERVAGLYGVSQIWMQSTEGIGGLNSESQQLTVMSRVVEGAQRSYHTEVFPRFEVALKVTDWHLRIRTPEESDELVELQIQQTRVAIAQMFASMGFGVEYDSEEDEFSFHGRVLSMEEQQKQQMEQANPFGGGGYGGDGGEGKPPAGGGQQGGGMVGGGGMAGAGMGAMGGGMGGQQNRNGTGMTPTAAMPGQSPTQMMSRSYKRSNPHSVPIGRR